MAVKASTPVMGRKRKYPVGSTTHRIKLKPKTQEALEAYIADYDVAPEDGAVLVAAVELFLIAKGKLAQGDVE